MKYKFLLILIFLVDCISSSTLIETDFYIVDKIVTRDNPLFTQGLFVDSKGYIIESGGGYGMSKLIKYNLESPNKTLASVSFNNQDFLEGSTQVNKTIFVLTWTQRIIYHFTDESDEIEHKIKEALPKTINLPSEINAGWGLTYNGEHLIISDGSNKIFFVDFNDLNKFKVVRSIQIQDKLGKKYDNLNELEYVDNKIFANVWHQNIILIICPLTGDVLNTLDFQDLVNYEEKLDNQITNSERVLNGIAYDFEKKYFIITGKEWKHLYIVKLK